MPDVLRLFSQLIRSWFGHGVFSFCSFRVTSSYILLLKSHTVAIMSQLNVFKYANIIVYCVTYSIKTICYIYEYMNMYKSAHIHICEYLNMGWGMRQVGVRSMYICSMTEIRFFTLVKLSQLLLKTAVNLEYVMFLCYKLYLFYFLLDFGGNIIYNYL